MHLTAAGLAGSELGIVDKAAYLQSNIHKVSTVTNNLTVSFYVMVGWVVVITAAIVAMAFFTYRRRRHQRRRAADDDLWEAESSIASSDANSMTADGERSEFSPVGSSGHHDRKEELDAVTSGDVTDGQTTARVDMDVNETESSRRFVDALVFRQS